MPDEVYILENSSAGISVTIERKNITSCRLKVFPSQRVKFSVPIATSSEWIVRYLQSKKDWISKKLEEFKKT
jgi:predicted metal-dependent hydrolase